MVLRLSVITGVSSSIRFAAGRWGGLLAASLVRSFGRLPRGPRERCAKIVDHGREVARERVPASDQHIIMMGLHRYRIEPLHHFAKPAPDAIALGGVAVLFGNGEADPDRAAVIAAKVLAAKVLAAKAFSVKALQDERGTIHPRAIGNGDEIRPLPQPIHDEIPKRGSGSGAQTLAAARAAGCENLAATGRGETSTETVTALAHQFAGLISPLHGFFSADRAICL
jgi:hypothetical protein